MRPNVTDGVARSVGLSFGRSVCHDREPGKNGWTDRDAVWDVDSGWSKEAWLRWRQTLAQPSEYHWTVCGGDAVFCQTTLTSCLYIFHGFWTNFTKLSVNVCKWIGQLLTICGSNILCTRTVYADKKLPLTISNSASSTNGIRCTRSWKKYKSS